MPTFARPRHQRLVRFLDPKMYSVEYIPKDDEYNCWNQYVLTPGKFRARLYAFELRLSRGRKNFIRTRVL